MHDREPGSRTVARTTAFAIGFCALAPWLGAVRPAAGQGNDPDFRPRVPRPAFSSGTGPLLLVDEAHRNLHRAGGRYTAFAAVATADGFRVRPSASGFGETAPPAGSVLVIANAAGAPVPAASAFSPQEIARLRAWIADGGALLLIADHAPFGAAAGGLSAALGVEMLDGHVRDPAHAAPELPGPYFLEFTRAAATLRDHPITRGRDAGERLARVVTFGGQALRAKPPAAVLLELGSAAESVDDPNDAHARVTGVGGLAQAVALELGKGRVVVVGEAGLFGAQRIDGEAAKKAGLPGALRFGMNHPGTDDQQFLLNTLRWLARVF